MQSRLGYHFRNSGAIVIGENYDAETFDHEMNHAVMGMFGNHFLDEAMTEHLMLGMEHGDMHVVDPSARADEGVYVAHRKLLANLVGSGADKELLGVAIEAYIEADEEGAANQSFRHFLAESYGGVDMIDFINHEVESRYAELAQQYPNDSPDALVIEAVDYAAGGVVLLATLQRHRTGEKTDYGFEGQALTNTMHDVRHMLKIADYVDAHPPTR
jgi:hypothetical protein